MSEPECQQCGDCCNKLGFVEFDYHDVLREPKLTDEFWHGVSKGRDPWSITGVLMFPCQFFDKAKKLCTIYPTRPY
ncbi:MAG: YkgJ family cysteine cluster protein, partial [Planctomycetes bacterium]|nr:YkgJ family cysteine cluster protein [Planctomycetota bacterium]